MKIGSFVCDKEDKDKECLAIVVIDHSVYGYPGSNSIKWISDGHLSTRDDEELQEITGEEFCKSWCKDEIQY